MRDYVLRLLFDDGTVGDVDFSGHEWTGVFENSVGSRVGHAEVIHMPSAERK
jgi:hypothetical protein